MIVNSRLATLGLIVDRVISLPIALLAWLYRARFAQTGSNFSFDPLGVYSYPNIHVGDNVNLGYRPVIIAARSKIIIGSHVMFGPQVTIRGGNHRIDSLGRYMATVKDEEKNAHRMILGWSLKTMCGLELAQLFWQVSQSVVVR